MVAAASMSNFLGSLICFPFAQNIAGVGEGDLVILAMFGVLQVGLGLTLFALGSRFLPSGQASLIATLETPLMPFWVWLALPKCRHCARSSAARWGWAPSFSTLWRIIGREARPCRWSSDREGAYSSGSVVNNSG